MVWLCGTDVPSGSGTPALLAVKVSSTMPAMRHDIVFRSQARAFVRGQAKVPGTHALEELANLLGVGAGDFSVGMIRQIIPDQLQVVDGIAIQSEPWLVEITPLSIDVTHFGTLDAPQPPPIALWSKCPDIFRILGAHRDTSATRLAAVTEGVLPEIDDATMVSLASRCLRLPRLFQSHPWEWDWRCVTSRTTPIANDDNELALLLTLKRISGLMNNEPFDRIRVDLDVNTPVADIRPRFQSSHIASFFSSVPARHQELWDAVDEMLGGQDADS